MATVDLTWAERSFAKRVNKLFERIHVDKDGRLSVEDMKLRFQRHAIPMLGDIEIIGGYECAFLSDNWRTILKDWAMCAGVWPYCPKEDPVWVKIKQKSVPKRRRKYK